MDTTRSYDTQTSAAISKNFPQNFPQNPWFSVVLTHKNRVKQPKNGYMTGSIPVSSTMTFQNPPNIWRVFLRVVLKTTTLQDTLKVLRVLFRPAGVAALLRMLTYPLRTLRFLVVLRLGRTENSAAVLPKGKRQGAQSCASKLRCNLVQNNAGEWRGGSLSLFL